MHKAPHTKYYFWWKKHVESLPHALARKKPISKIVPGKDDVITFCWVTALVVLRRLQFAWVFCRRVNKSHRFRMLWTVVLAGVVAEIVVVLLMCLPISVAM